MPLLAGVLLLLGFPALCQGHSQVGHDTNAADPSKKAMKETRIKVRIGAKTFTATLADTPAASAFKAMLPLSLNMSDLHGNEKVSHLPSPLPSNDTNPGTLETGDLMLWNSKSVVLFYQTFSTPYSYTRLGRIESAGGLPSALGRGDVSIVFEAE